MKAIWNHFGGFGKLLLFILLVFSSFVVFSTIGYLAAIPFMDGFSITSPDSNTLSVDLLRYFQIVQSFSVFIIPSLLAGLLFWGHFTRGIGLHQPNPRLIMLSMLIIISVQPLSSFLGVWNSNMNLPEFLSGTEEWMRQAEESARHIIFDFLDTDSLSLLFINLIMIAILPAVGEEMLFRGVLQPVFGELVKNKHLAVFITAFLFSAIHFQFFTFLPRFILGLALGYLMLWGKNLWYPVAGHFANNFMSLVVFYYYQLMHPGVNPMNPSTGDISSGWIILGSLTTILLFGAFVYFKKQDTLLFKRPSE